MLKQLKVKLPAVFSTSRCWDQGQVLGVETAAGQEQEGGAGEYSATVLNKELLAELFF